MLIASNTPRMSQRIGIRAWLEAVAGKSVPSLVAGAEGEVAAEFTGICRFYRESAGQSLKADICGITKVLPGMCRLALGMPTSDEIR